MCGASVSGYVATQFELVWVAMFGPAGLVDGVSGVTVIIAHWGAPPRSVDQSWLSCFVFQNILQALPVALCCSVSAWGCGLVFGLISRFIPATGWPVSRLVLESVFLGCQDFSPSICKQVLISLELLLLLLQAPRSGYKPTLEALLFHGILRHAELIVAEANLVFGRGACSCLPPGIRPSPVLLS